MTSGMNFRGRIPATASGNTRVIQMRNLGDDNLVHLAEAMRVDMSDPKPEYLAEAGDIIFRSRGQTYTAALLTGQTTDTIVAAPLFRVRIIDTGKVLPEYLLWWINQPSSQRYFLSSARGTMIQMISKQILGNLKVSVPPLEKQAKIAEIASLASREQVILEEIRRSRQQYIDQVLLQTVSESHSTPNERIQR